MSNVVKVLIVDDDRAVRRMLTRLLEQAGHTVQAARDGREGLGLLSEDQDYDLVLLDLHLPRVSGTDVLRLLKQRFPTLPVIVLSAYVNIGSAKSRDLTQKHGAIHVFSKPFDGNKLLAAVSELGYPTSTASYDPRYINN